MKKSRRTSTSDVQQAEVRKHYFLDQYAVIAPKRSKRPRMLEDGEPVSFKTTAAPPIENNPSVLEIPHPTRETWAVKVVENKYPAFSEDNQAAYGRQEVVLETSERLTPFNDLAVDQVVRVLQAYQSRVHELRRLKAISYVSVFKNHGREAGASLSHTHSQIIATGIVPPEVHQERRALTTYQKKHGTSPLCDALRWEVQQHSRMIHRGKKVSCFAPYASRMPLEAWIVPHRQVRSVTDLEPEELQAVAQQLKGIANAFETKTLSYNFHLMEPVEGYRNHFYIKVFSRTNVQAGFEFNTGLFINPIAPEQAARWYRGFVR